MDIDLRELINEYFIKSNEIYNDKFDVINYISVKIINILNPIINNANFKNQIKNYKNFKVYSIEERLDLVKEYLEKNNIDFDLEKNIIAGTIRFRKETYEEEIEKERIYFPDMAGKSYLDSNGEKLIDVNNTGYIFDSSVLVHEISHHRNLTNYGRSEIGNLLTEGIAYTEEIIFIYNQLFQHGKALESKYIINQILYAIYDASCKLYYISKLFYVYYKFSDIDEESYKILYGNTKQYRKTLNEQIKLIKNEYNVNISSKVHLIIAGLLMPYLFMNYIEDNKFFETIQKLHTKINTCSINEILSFIGLSGNIFDIIDEVSSYLEQFCLFFEEKNELVKKFNLL